MAETTPNPATPATPSSAPVAPAPPEPPHVDLDALEAELQTEKRGYALELAQGNFTNIDRYQRVNERLRYLAEARGIPATRHRAAAGEATAPHGKEARKDKDAHKS